MKTSRETLPLSEAVTHLLEECRMVLPGIQALFGFQLIAVFNSTFQEKLSSNEKLLHLTAIGFVALAVALVMSPAAMHRQKDPQTVTQKFLFLAGRFLLLSMFPLLLGMGLDFYLIARVILNNARISFMLAVILFLVFSSLWFVFPRLEFAKDDHS